MSVDMNQFHSVFFEESVEHLQTMEELLLNMSTEDPDPEDLNSIFRAAHSIKGGSGIFGFDALTGLTHVMETILDKARNHELALSPDIVDTLLSTSDILSAILQAYQDETPIDWDAIEAGTKALKAILHEDGNVTIEHAEEDDGFGFFDNAPTATSDLDDDDGFGFFDDDAGSNSSAKQMADDDLDGFGFFDEEPSTAEVKSEEEDVSFGFFEEPTDTAPTPQVTTAETDDGFGFFEEPTPPQAQDSTEEKGYGFFTQVGKQNAPAEKPTRPAAAKTENKAPVAKTSKPAAKEASSIRVDTIKIDSVVNLVGEMVITQSMLRNIGHEVEGNAGDKLESAIDELSRNIREIQEAVMSMRMLPVSFVFNRFPRLVRDLAGKLGKKIDLVIEGGNTEVDKSMIEKLADPLTHLVRNSLDHGIESADVRASVGKPETGTVVLKAEQRGSNILISIKDDGGGLNREKILDKARGNGMDVHDSMPDKDVWKLIFEPGFSTAEAVTDVSGRGVGMDVVRKNIEAVKGSIEIESEAGVGSTFIIRLPLTLAIVDGMCVAVGDQTMVVPLTNIVESFQPNVAQMKSLNKDTLLWVREEYWPLVRLHDLMEIDDAIIDPTKAIVVLIESSKNRFGLLVDSLVGQQQVVIKSLEQHYRKVPCVAGATIMGDGSVALILDIESIATRVKQIHPREMANAG